MTPGIWTGMYAELPLHDAFRTLHECGWPAFEISTEHLVAIEKNRDPERLVAEARNCLQDLNLCAPQAHLFIKADVASPVKENREQDISRLKRHIEIASGLGVRNAVVHPGGHKLNLKQEKDTVMRLNAQAFRRLGDFAGERNMCIAIENMAAPGFAASAAELLELLRLIDHPAIGITLDTSHANMSSLNIPEMIRDFASDLIATHISDNDGASDQHLNPGNGTIDWLTVMDAFHDIGYDGIFNLENPGERHENLTFRRLKTRYAFTVTEWLVGLHASDYEEG